MTDPYKKTIVLASELGAHLDSDVTLGGGTDDTEILQKFLDTAPEKGSIRLIMDGAALVRGLRVHSNTTIECMNKTCGFYLADGSDCAVIKNYHLSYTKRTDHDIALIGGVYNQNCLNQRHDGMYTPLDGEDFTIPGEENVTENVGESISIWTVGLRFYGVTWLTVRDVTIRDQRTFAGLFANCEHVDMQNILIDLPNKMYAQNQDGLHFWGPSRFITLKNISGDVGDDFIALAPGEHDCKSDITDVLIDGVILNNADQGIRLLSRKDATLDRVIIKNVTGTYRSFGFYVNPWFPGEKPGHFGHITFDTIDIRSTDKAYDYCDQFLFKIGGRVDCLTLRNITHFEPNDDRALMYIGKPFYAELEKGTADVYNDIRQIEIDGLNVVKTDKASANAQYIHVDCTVDHLRLSDVTVINDGGEETKGGKLLTLGEEGHIGTLLADGIYTEGLDKVFDCEGKTDRFICRNVDEF